MAWSTGSDHKPACSHVPLQPSWQESAGKCTDHLQSIGTAASDSGDSDEPPEDEDNAFLECSGCVNSNEQQEMLQFLLLQGEDKATRSAQDNASTCSKTPLLNKVC